MNGVSAFRLLRQAFIPIERFALIPMIPAWHGHSGKFEILPYEGKNPLYKHGALKVAADHRHFAHFDGTPFLWLADTWWMGLCKRLAWPEDFETLLFDRLDKGFSVIQIVAGLYPIWIPSMSGESTKPVIPGRKIFRASIRLISTAPICAWRVW